MQIIPAILAKSEKEFLEKAKAVLPYVKMVQIDIMDGKFVPNKTWGVPKTVKKILKQTGFEVHLMVKNPEKNAAKWANAGAKRIIYHFEATKNHEKIIKKINSLRCEVGIAINPETPAKKLLPYIYDINFVLVMGVRPGFSGQKFCNKVLGKIREIKKMNKKIKIGVDGGVNLKTAKKMVSAGADVLNAANAIFMSGNAKETIKKFKNI